MKIGVVGYGSIGKRHATNLRALGFQPVIYDPVYPSEIRFERTIYETCDAVVIATPSPYHWGAIRACAERGRHMLVEKPICTGDVPGLQASLDLAKNMGSVVMMGTNLRFHPSVIQAKHWLDKKRVGLPFWASFTCAAKSVKPLYLSDGVTLNTGSHEVDLALHLLGPAKVVSATVRFIAGSGTDDISDFVLLHDNGCRSTFHLDFVTNDQLREFRIVGDGGEMWCNLLNRYLTERVESANPVVQYGPGIWSGGSYDDDYVAEMEDFLYQCGADMPAFAYKVGGRGATGDDGLAALRILLDVRKMAGLP